MFNLPYIKQYIFKYRSARGDHLQLQVQDMSGDGNIRGKGRLHPKWLSQNVKKCYLTKTVRRAPYACNILTRLAILIDTYME